MQNKYHFLFIFTLVAALFTACQDEEYKVPKGTTVLKNDCIKRTLGPNIIGNTIEFAYAMALPQENGKLVSAKVEASIAGASGTYLENRSFYTNGSGQDVGIQIGDPSITEGIKTEVTFTKDTCASTLRYFYRIPEEARGKQVTFKFSVSASTGETQSYLMGPYEIAKMDMKLNLVTKDGAACFISIEDMAVYTAAEAATKAEKIDLVYLYRTLNGVTFAHGLVSPAADAIYLPGVTLPTGVNKSTKLIKAWNLRDRHLADLQYGIYIDDIDLMNMNMAGAPNFGINLKAESGAWIETSDGKYKAYIYVNKIDNTAKTMTISMKRITLN